MVHCHTKYIIFMLKLPLLTDERAYQGVDSEQYVTPTRLSCQTNSVCNLDCAFCYLKGHKRDMREAGSDGSSVSKDKYYEMVSSLDQNILDIIFFVGAELLATVDESNELLRCTRDDLKKKIEIVTNLAANPEKVDRLFKGIEPEDISILKVSIDSKTPDVHDEIRGREGLHAQTVQNVERLVKDGYKIRAQMTVMPDNYGQTMDFIKYFHDEKGVRSFSFHGATFESNDSALPEWYIDPIAWRALYEKAMQFKDANPGVSIKMPLIFFTPGEMKEIVLGGSEKLADYDAYIAGEITKPFVTCLANPHSGQYLIANAATPVISLCNVISMTTAMHGKMQYAKWDTEIKAFRPVRKNDSPLWQETDLLNGGKNFCPATPWATRQDSDLIQSKIVPTHPSFYHVCRYFGHPKIDVKPKGFDQYYSEAVRYYGGK